MVNDNLLVRDLLLAIVDEAKSHAGATKEGQLISSEMAVRWSKLRNLEASEIKQRFKDDGPIDLDMLQEGTQLVLGFPHKGATFVGVASLQIKISDRQMTYAKILAAMFMLEDPTAASVNLQCVGFRFELPENPGGSGRHDFHHAQMITHFEKRDASLALPTVPWISTSQPSFPLPAKKPVHLLLCALMALYGQTYLTSLALRIRGLGSYLKEVLDSCS